MFCDQCGNPVGDSEKFCSRCGAPILPLGQEQAEPEKPEQETVTPESGQAAVTPEPEQPIALSVPVKQEPPVAPAIPDEPAVRGKKGGKKSGKKAVFFALGGVLLVLVAVCVVNAGKIANFFSRSFSSPEKYYRQIEQETVERMAEQYSAYYDMLVGNPLRLDETSLDTEFTVELGEGGKSFREFDTSF